MLIEHLTPAQQARSTQLMQIEDYRIIASILGDMACIDREERNRKPLRGGHCFTIVFMILILLYREVNRKSLAGTKLSLEADQELLQTLGAPTRRGRFICPSVGSMSHFLNKVWPNLENEVGSYMRERFSENCAGMFYTCDSTPLEASRYSSYWHYNQHYNIRMGKLHIIMGNGHPLYYSLTNANDGDNPELLKMLERIGQMPCRAIGFATDGSYASFETYSVVYRLTGKLMASNPAKTAVQHEEITWNYLVGKYAKLWKAPGYRPVGEVRRDFIIRFLINHGYREIVGTFLRDVDMRRGRMSDLEKQNRRHVCEEVHRAAKRWIALDVRGLRVKTAAIAISFKFFLVQLFSYIFLEYR